MKKKKKSRTETLSFAYLFVLSWIPELNPDLLLALGDSVPNEETALFAVIG